ncbi:hypothetical protein Tco_0529304 [Tanacetum coccineum]
MNLTESILCSRVPVVVPIVLASPTMLSDMASLLQVSVRTRDRLTTVLNAGIAHIIACAGVVKYEIRGNVNFEIKGQFMRELREDTFSWNKNNDAYEYVERILDIVNLFNIPGVTHDAVMLCVFPITLTGATKRWVDRLSLGTINTWDLLKKAFIQRYCPPSKMAKQLEVIHNFKQEGKDTLYQAWERYNDLLYKCLTHDLNSHKKVNIFYKGLDTMTHKLLDSQGLIPNKTPTQALDTIQTMVDHSYLRRDMKKVKENVHAIQVGCENYEGAYLNTECPLNEEFKAIFANNEAPTDEASSKGTTELHRVSFISNDSVQVSKEPEEGLKESCHANYHQKN